jgi:hypothetical protein
VAVLVSHYNFTHISKHLVAHETEQNTRFTHNRTTNLSIKMKYTVALAALASAVSAQAAAPTGYFSVISARSASPIHFQTLTARGGKFYLGGGPPSSYCPVEQVGSACPAGNTTVLVGGDKTLSMGVIVPGGQEVYVGPDGALSYTQAHSAFVPEGSVRDQFSREAPVGDAGFGYLNFETGFVACPAANTTTYQVYGQVDSATFGPECLGFSMLTGKFALIPY